MGWMPEGRSGETSAPVSDMGQQELRGWEAFQGVNVLPPMAQEIAGKRGQALLGRRAQRTGDPAGFCTAK